MTRATYRADALLLLAAAIWGAAFVAQRTAMQHVGPFLFTGVRFLLGTLVLLPLLHGRARAAPVAGRSGLRAGLLAGLLLFAGANLQQAGLIFTTAGKAGFITGLYVVLVPLLGLFLGHRTPAATWGGAVLAFAGLYLLSITERWTVNPGDLLVLGGAVVWAAHVLLIGHLAPRLDPLRLAAGQFTVNAALSLAAGLIWEPASPAALWAARWAILYGGICAVGIGYTLQVIAQRAAPPGHAAILLSCEAVFAALAGWGFLDEKLTNRERLGCVLMFGGVVLSQLRRPPARAPGP